MFEVAAIPHEILREPFEQFRMRWRLVETEIIDRLEEAQAKISLPEAIDDGGGKTRIGRIDQADGEELEAGLARGGRKIRERKRECGRDESARLFLATDGFHIALGEQAGQSKEARLRPFRVEEMIVTTGAFHARAQ